MTLLRLYGIREGRETTAPGVWVYSLGMRDEFTQANSKAGDPYAAAEALGFSGFDVIEHSVGCFSVEASDLNGGGSVTDADMWNLSVPAACRWLSDAVQEAIEELKSSGRGQSDEELAHEVCKAAPAAFLIWNDRVLQANVEPTHGVMAHIDEPDDSPYLEQLGMYTGISEPVDFQVKTANSQIEKDPRLDKKRRRVAPR